MTNPWEQDLDDNDGFVDGIDDETDELGIDYHTGVGMDHTYEGRGSMPLEGVEDDSPVPQVHRPNSHPDIKGRPSKSARIRPMSARMAARFPQVASMLLTMTDGRQVLFVRGKRG